MGRLHYILTFGDYAETKFVCKNRAKVERRRLKKRAHKRVRAMAKKQLKTEVNYG